MNLNEFKKGMKKKVFSYEEARIIAFRTPAATLKLELHQWKRAHKLIGLKRGLYMFAEGQVNEAEIARALCSPSYISLEYALNHYGLLPDVPFAVTLVTTKTTRKFNTPSGQFSYQKILPGAFCGFDPDTMMAEREKAIVDHLYLGKNRMIANENFWRDMRWQNLNEVDFRKAFEFAQKFGSKKLLFLLGSLEAYAKTHPIT